MNIRVTRVEELNSFTSMATKIGLDGIVTPIFHESPVIVLDNGFKLYTRTNLYGTKLNSLKGQLSHARKKSIIVRHI